MNLIYLFIPLAWGQLSTQLFFKGWISFLGLIYCCLGIVRKHKQAVAILEIAFTRITHTALHTAVLFLGFYLLYYYFRIGQTSAEKLVFLIAAMVRMVFILPGASQAIDKVIRDVYDL